MAASKEDSIAFLYGLINKSLRITTTDDRIFYGEFRCIDPDCNVVLARTFEYRQQPRAGAAARPAAAEPHDIDKTARYLGLVVVPGEHIVAVAAEQRDLSSDMAMRLLR